MLHSLQETVFRFTGNTPDLDALTFALGITGKDALVRLQIEDVDCALTFWEQTLNTYKDTVQVFDGIEMLLRDLTTKGLRLGIVTSKTREEYGGIRKSPWQSTEDGHQPIHEELHV